MDSQPPEEVKNEDSKGKLDHSLFKIFLLKRVDKQI